MTTKKKTKYRIAQGDALRQLRIRAKFTQEQVADKFGHSKMWLSDIENGYANIYMEDGFYLCELYNSDFNELRDMINVRLER